MTDDIHTKLSDNEEGSVEQTFDSEEIEMVDEEGDELRKEDAIKKWRDKFATCDKEKRELHEELQRIRADFLNARRMQAEQLTLDRERIGRQYIESMLPLADSFDMAMSDPLWQSCDEKWRQGIEGIRAQLMRVLELDGVTEISKTGIPFNPHEHEAVSSAPALEDMPADTVLAVIQKGYKRKDIVVRPARVVVSA